MIKKIVLSLIIFVCSLNIYASEYVNTKNYLKINVPAAVVIDDNTHRVLYDKNANEQRSIASLTKVMTSILLIENCDLNEVINVPDEATWVGGSELGLKKGDTITTYNLLVGMLLPSGNDAAFTTGIHVGGTIEKFAEMMTEKAKQIGALNTSFKNAHGLDVEGHYSTAYDMALITSYALKNDVINKIVGSTSLSITYGKTTRTLNNTNRLLKSYAYVDGVKTGYTDNAERCVITSGTKNNFRIISVVLGATDTNTRFNTAKDLMDKTFELYKNDDLSKMMNWYVKIPVIKGENEYYEANILDSMTYPIISEEYDNIYVKQEFLKEIYAPMPKGTYLGNIKMYLGEEEIYLKDIFLTEDLNKRSMNQYFKDGLNSIFKKSNILDSWIIKYYVN
ncbi:MAG: D-alanyl-D-alanine carboxypeptidase [Clostridia bacterium]|nr:D-alanyl-D-alanine carboxypeptidase [Clostridia bacterium]MDD4386803.1 D-alanyl-D-alanine carboxypeptidase [Clostridia bacterium]